MKTYRITEKTLDGSLVSVIDNVPEGKIDAERARMELAKLHTDNVIGVVEYTPFMAASGR